MCGICGVLSAGAPVPAARIEAMNGTLVHRGPDGGGVHLGRAGDVHVGLGHRRLAVIDLSTGTQPIANEDGSVVAIVNGEIYNFEELRRELEGRGHRFSTRSDCEPIVHLWEEEGPGLLARLVGMFALAIWDERRGRLLLARDRMGQKPLFYRAEGSTLSFASRLETLLVGAAAPEVDPVSLDLYLALQYCPSPRTILEGYSKLPPAHYLLWERGRRRVERYWWPRPAAKRPRTVDEASEGLAATLSEAVRSQLVSDVPLGAFLSGGVDSSIVVSQMARHSRARVRTFTIGFDDPRWDETRWARQVAERHGTEHSEFVVRPSAREILDDLVGHYAEPFADSSAIPTWYVSKLARESVTVALSGDGGDELFGGYPRYLGLALSAPLAAFLPGPAAALGAAAAELLWRDRSRRSAASRAAKLLGGLAQPPLARYADWMSYFCRIERASLYRPEWAARLPPNAPLEFFERTLSPHPYRGVVGSVQFLDLLTYLPELLLVKVDVASMAHGLEVRSPFLDHRVVEAALAIPTRWNFRGTASKWILRRAFADALPEGVRRRGKQGFGVPLGDWFRGELSGLLRDLLLDPSARIGRWLRLPVVHRLVAEHLAGRASHEYRLWSLLFLEMWCRRFLDGPARATWTCANS